MKIIIKAKRTPFTMMSTGPLFLGCVKSGMTPGGGVRPGSWRTVGSFREAGEIDWDISKEWSGRDVIGAEKMGRSKARRTIELSMPGRTARLNESRIDKMTHGEYECAWLQVFYTAFKTTIQPSKYRTYSSLNTGAEPAALLTDSRTGSANLLLS